MRRNLAVLVLLAAAATGACAGSQQETGATTPAPARAATPTPAPAPVIDPVGTYEFSTVVEGQTVTGTMTIAGTPGAYSGKIVTNLFPEIPVIGARVEEKTVIALASMPDGELTIRMLMDGMQFTGRWELSGESGEFNGKKLPR